jgi:hypothetical protein
VSFLELSFKRIGLALWLVPLLGIGSSHSSKIRSSNEDFYNTNPFATACSWLCIHISWQALPAASQRHSSKQNHRNQSRHLYHSKHAISTKDRHLEDDSSSLSSEFRTRLGCFNQLQAFRIVL